MRVCHTNPTLFLVKRPLIESVVVEVLFRREVVEEWMDGENIAVRRPVRGRGAALAGKLTDDSIGGRLESSESPGFSFGR